MYAELPLCQALVGVISGSTQQSSCEAEFITPIFLARELRLGEVK